MLAFVRQGNRSSGAFTLKPTGQSTRDGRPEMPFDIWQPNYRNRSIAGASKITSQRLLSAGAVTRHWAIWPKCGRNFACR